MVIIELTDKDFEVCEKFSKDIDTSHYSLRNQTNSTKKIKDQKIGKLGELATYYFLKNKIDISYPDFNIYDAKNKSWDFDLKSKEFNFHVKSQDVKQSSKYGESWIFQNQDKKIFKTYSENDYVSFVIVDLEKKQAKIKSITSIDFLHKNKLFHLPKLIQLQNNNKLAVYFSELEKCDRKEIWKF